MSSRVALAAISRALTRETETLTRHPGLLWQQLSNRLRWDEEPAVREFLEPRERERTAPGEPPWMRTLRPFVESSGLRRSFAAHTAPVTSCKVSPDGKFVVSASDDQTLKLWEPASGREIRTLRGHRDRVSGCSIAPDGSYIVSAGFDEGAIWDVATGEPIRRLRSAGTPEQRRMWCCALSPDGKFVVTGGNDNVARVWNPATGEELRPLRGHRGPVRTCDVSPDGRHVVTGSVDKTLWIWNPAMTEAPRVLVGHESHVAACAWSPDGSFIVSVGWDGMVFVWDPHTGREIRSWRASTEENTTSCCAITPDARRVLATSVENEVLIWEVDSGELVASLRGHAGGVFACTVSPDGTFLVSGGTDGLKVWDPAAAEEAGSREDHPLDATAAEFAPDGSVVTSGLEGALKVWDPATGSCVRTLPVLAGLLDCAITPDGTSAVTAGQGGIVIVDLASGESELTIGKGGSATFQDTATLGCSVDPGGAFVLSASGDRTVGIWDRRTGERLGTLRGHTGSGEDDDVTGLAAWVTHCAVSPDRSYIVSASSDHTLKVWDPASGAALRTLSGHEEMVHRCAVSPDGSFVVSASFDQTLRIWDPATAETLRVLDGHGGVVWDCAVSPDGRMVASVGDDRALRLWSAQTGDELGVVFLPGRPRCVALHPRRPMAAAGDESGVVYLVDLVGFGYGPIVAPPPLVGPIPVQVGGAEEEEPSSVTTMYYLLIRSLGLRTMEQVVSRQQRDKLIGRARERQAPDPGRWEDA